MNVNGHADEDGSQKREHVRLNQTDQNLKNRNAQSQRTAQEHQHSADGAQSQQLRDDSNLTISLRIIDPTDHNKDSHRYNRPTVDKVAAIIPISEDSTYVRDITLKRRSDGQFQRIPHTSPKYMPLMYPLLFPNGEDGWHPRIPMTSRNTHSSKRAWPPSAGNVSNIDIDNGNDGESSVHKQTRCTIT